MFIDIFTFNNIFAILFTLINFSLLVIAYKLFGKIGLFSWIVMSSIVANIIVTKVVDLFWFEAATLGNATYGSIFLATDVLSEKYTKKDAKMSVYLGFFAIISSTLIIQLALLFNPVYQDIQDNLQGVFALAPRIVIGSLCAFLISQLLDITLFERIKQKMPETKFLWIRNNGSTLISQLLDSIVFVLIAFYGVFELNILLSILISTYILKLLVAILDTPFLYLIKKITPLNEKDENPL